MPGEMFAEPEKIRLTCIWGCAASFSLTCRLGSLETRFMFLINLRIHKSLLVVVPFFSECEWTECERQKSQWLIVNIK